MPDRDSFAFSLKQHPIQYSERPSYVTPKRLLTEAHCTECGHLYDEHLVGMNTVQTGECLHCKCVMPETAGRDELWEEIALLREEVKDEH